MAFSSTYNNEIYSTWEPNFPCSDSDDHFNSYNLGNITDYIQPIYNEGNENQMSLEPLPNNRASSGFNLSTPCVAACNDAVSYDQFFAKNGEYDAAMQEELVYDQEERLTRMDEMELEGSDYHTTVMPYDNETSSTLTISANPSDLHFSNNSSKFESSTSHHLSTEYNGSSLRLRELIVRLLEGREIHESELVGLNQYERDVLKFINQKKSKSEGTKTSRRREEKQKLFFKAALKFIQNRFLANLSKANGIKKKDIDINVFYRAYFQEAAMEKGLDITDFYPPNQKIRGQSAKRELKSFNLKYIELLLSSKRFLEETLEFLDNHFAQNYAKARYTKIDKILQHASDIYEQTYRLFVKNNNQNQTDFKEVVRRRLQDLIVTNAKSKLPWSDAELNEAKEFARETIMKIHYKTNNMY